ncbi:MAG: DUF427 domain-containing protein, partial [Actinomycetota bacterium]|nr:DUF427 domain-containing protein [Actinomycetota bacterium]
PAPGTVKTMGLMTGTGPLGLHPAGELNFEPPPPGRALYLEPTPKRIRVIVKDEVVADSLHAMLLHEGGSQPIYYFSPEDVRQDVLEPSDTVTHCPKKGDASYHSLRVGERVVTDAAWYYPEPIAGAPPIAGLIAFYWDRVDHWLEEEEEVFFHPRDPYHRIEILPSSRQVRVLRKGTLLAESDRAIALFETGLPPRWYLPRADVVAELRPSDTVTGCPYKGEASYFSPVVDGRVVEDVIWTYADPRPEATMIKGLLAFYDERVDVELDGVPQERPESPWSRNFAEPPSLTRG